MSTINTKSSGKSDKSVRKKIEELGDELAYLQRKSREMGIPVLIIVEGLSAAGKGTLINRIINHSIHGALRFPVLPPPTGMSSCVLFFGVFGVVRHLPTAWLFSTVAGIATYLIRQSTEHSVMRS
jgi:polyphosphate kinase 2 (PPK2 family)